MGHRALLAFALVVVYGTVVFANNYLPPEPCFRCPSSRLIDDSVCGSELYQFNYCGDWQHCNQGCTQDSYQCTESTSCDPNASVRFSFVGNRIKLYSSVGPWGGEACVKIDYKNPTNVNFFSYNCKGGVLVFDSGLLPYGRHTLLVSNQSNQSDKKISIDYVEVLRYPNLLQNPSFEEKCPNLYSPSRLPPRWSADAFNSPATLEWVCGQAHSGSYSFLVSSSIPNDARVDQTTNVRRNTNCLLSGWIKTENVGHTQQSVDAGANICLLTQYPPLAFVRTAGLFGTNDWTQQYLTFNTLDLDFITVAGRLGFFSGTTTGSAWFDDFELICEDF